MYMSKEAFRTVCKAMSNGFGVDPDRIELDDMLCEDWGFSGEDINVLFVMLGLRDTFGKVVTVRELVDAVHIVI